MSVGLNNAARPGLGAVQALICSQCGRSAREHKFTGAWT